MKDGKKNMSHDENRSELQRQKNTCESLRAGEHTRGLSTRGLYIFPNMRGIYSLVSLIKESCNLLIKGNAEIRHCRKHLVHIFGVFLEGLQHYGILSIPTSALTKTNISWKSSTH